MSRFINAIALKNAHGDPASMWFNDDIRPLPPHRRTWTGLTYFTYQSSCGIIIVTWSVGASLLGFGLNAWQAILDVVIGYTLVGVLTMLGSQIGGKWHIGFPVSNRFVWGMRGNAFPVVNRVILMTIWFGTESWLGGMCIKTTLGAIWPSLYTMKNTLPASVPMETNDFVCWLVFVIICAFCVMIKPEDFHYPSVCIACGTFVSSLAITGWFVNKAGGSGVLFHSTESLTDVAPAVGSNLGWMFVRGITTVISSQSTGIMGFADWGRYAKYPNAQLLPQGLGMGLSDMYTAIVGVICASCAATIYPDAGLVWNPALVLAQVQLHEKPSARAAIFFAILPILASQISVTVSASCLNGGLDLSGLCPKFINLRRGGYIILVVAVLIQPWQFANTDNKFISVMGSYAVFLAPLTAILHTDYYIVRKQRISLIDLYTPDHTSTYWFFHGFNWRPMVSFLLGFTFFLPGFIHSITPSIEVSLGWTHLSHLNYPLGYFGTMTIYYALNWMSPLAELGKVDAYDHFGTFGSAENAPFGSAVGLPADSNNKSGSTEIVEKGL